MTPKAERTFVMTGASRGIGRHAAARLLADAPDVQLIVAVRGEIGPRLAADLRAESGNHNVSWVGADLGSLMSVRAAAEELGRRLDAGQLPPLAGFIGNAGLQMTSASRASADGLEMTFAVNVLANHLFIRLFASRFTSPARIVITTSDTHFGDFRHNLGLVPAPQWRHPLELAEPGKGPKADTVTAGRRAYSTSKLAVIYLVHALAHRMPGVDVYSWNPGLVPATGLARDAGPVQRFTMRRILPVLTLTPISVGARAAGKLLSRAAIGPRPAESGAYISLDSVECSSAESYDPGREDDLWAAVDKLSGLS